MGKPGPQGSLPAEFIGRRERTQGTETSQYLKEEKSTEIPKVVASELGRALQFLAIFLTERSGKSGHSG